MTMFFARHIFNESHGAKQFPIGSLPYWAVELDYCSESDAQRVAQYANLWKISFCTVAIAENVLNCDQVIALYSLSEDCDEVDLDEDPVDPALIPLLPAAEARAYRLIPWRKCGNHIYYVTDSPHLFAQLYRQKSYFRAHAKIVLTHPDAWQKALAQHYGAPLIQDAEASVTKTLSCRTLFATPHHTRMWAVGITAVLAGGAMINFAHTLTALIVLALIAMLAMQSLKLLALYARAPTSHKDTAPLTPEEKNEMDAPLISIMVPLFKETEIARTLLQRLEKLEYPRARLDIVLVLEAEDHQTAGVIARTYLPGHIRAIAVPPGSVTTKPRALRRLGCWDAFNVTKDADLGILLARAGYRTEFIITTTYEEVNNRAIP